MARQPEVIDVFIKDENDEDVWIQQLSSIEKSQFLPQGLQDLRELESIPAPPPVGRKRFFVQAGEFKCIDENGVVTVFGSGGGGGSSQLACSEQELTASVVVESNQACFAENMTVPAGTSLTIQAGGRLKIFAS